MSPIGPLAQPAIPALAPSDDPRPHQLLQAQTAAPAGLIAGVASGGFVPVRALTPHRLGARWLARSRASSEPAMLYRIDADALPRGPGDSLDRLAAPASLSHPHVLPILASWCEPGAIWLAAPYTGGHDGAVSLARLVASKRGGRLELDEAARAAVHLLGALVAADEHAVFHGPIRLDDVLVDRRGRALLELFGVEWALAGHGAPTRIEAAGQLRSTFELLYEAITGVPSAESPVPLRRMLRACGRAWSAWIQSGLEGDAFGSALDALHAMPALR